MFNFQTLAVPLNNWLSKETKKSGEELQAKIEALQADQQALNEQEALNHNASILDDIDWSLLNKKYVELLRKEIAIRNDLTQWLHNEKQDKEKERAKAFEKWEKMKADVFSSLVKLGYDEADPKTKGFVNLNSKVADLYRQANSHPDATYIQNNEAAIATLQAELQTMRERKLI